MLLRSIVALAILCGPLIACASPSTRSSAVSDMDRQHEALMNTMPGGGGGGAGGGM